MQIQLPDNDTCYRALTARDTRFDGKFFVAVKSTRIYCRPVCRVKAALRKNCTFYATAAAAEEAGYRPCLRCRPELAPGSSHMEANNRLTTLAMQRIEAGALSGDSIADLADEFGVTDRHLRRVLVQELGASPIALAQTRRLLTAKQLLTDTAMSVTDIAFASGFASVRRFNALFKERYRLSPAALRKSLGTSEKAQVLRISLTYRPPLAWPQMLAFLRDRSVSGVELVNDGSYQRTVSHGAHSGVVRVSCDSEHHQLYAELSADLLPVLLPVTSRLRRLFDLDAEPTLIAENLGALAQQNPGLRVPGAYDAFETAVRAILGQQVSVKAATTLAGRLAENFGNTCNTEVPGLTRLNPTAEQIAQLSIKDMTGLGIIASRAQAIHALATAVASKQLSLEPAVDVEAQMRALKELPGIGEWTAQYIAMRCFAWPDAFPAGDLAVMKAMGLKKEKEILACAEKWRPWRSYAVMHLWASLGAKKNSRGEQ